MISVWKVVVVISTIPDDFNQTAQTIPTVVDKGVQD